MRKKLGLISLSLALWGCQSENRSVEGSQGNTRVSISVGSPTPPPGEGVAVVSSATPEAQVNVDVESGGNQVKIDEDGVQVQGSQGAQVKVDQEGVSINAGQGSIPVDGASSTETEGDKLVIEGVGDKKTYKVDHKEVEINGTGHNLKLTGSVTGLEVNGTSNTVEVEKVEDVEVNGTGNNVLYAGPKPKIELNGLGNDCQPR
ncbi:DUF3060 domain-containing protein [bacterium]|nr:DUF3060 domain-containing protein [bacterium]